MRGSGALADSRSSAHQPEIQIGATTTPTAVSVMNGYLIAAPAPECSARSFEFISTVGHPCVACHTRFGNTHAAAIATPAQSQPLRKMNR